MPLSDPPPADLLVRCLSLLSATDQTSWSKEGKQIIEGEVRKAAALQNGSLLSAAFDLIAMIAQLARSGSNEGPAEALESAARDLTQPLDQYGTGLCQFTQALLEETVTALLQTVGLLKAPLKDTDSIEPAASLIALLQQLRRQLCAEPDFRVPGSLISRSQAVLLGSADQRAAKHNPLPSATQAFRGRDALLMRMQQTLSDVQALGRRTVLVRSRRGMGKTQLVLTFVQRHLTQYDKVLWLSASTPAWRVRYLQLGPYLGVDLVAQASWEERAAQVRAGIQMYPGRLLLVIDGADESVDLSAIVPSDGRGVLHLVVTTSTPEMKVAGSVEMEVPELSDGHAMALLRGAEEAGSAASEGNLAAAAASFKDLTLTVAVAACLFREGAAVPSALLANADPLGLQSNRKRSDGSGQFWLGRCCYEALRFLEESGKEKALLASTSALVGGWFGPGGITLDLLVSGLQWHIGSRVNSTKVEAALVELSRLGIATRQGDGSVVFPSVLRNYVAADKKRGGHHSMLRALASTSCDYSNSDHFRAVWLRRAELADSYARKQLVLLIGLKTVQFFVAGSGEYSAAEALCTQALAWLGKEEPTWRSEFTAAQAQALAAQRKYAAAAQIWQAQTQTAEPADEEETFMPKNFRVGVRPLPLDLSQSQDMSVYAPQKTPESPESPGSPDGSLDIFHAALPNLRTTPLPEANGKAETIIGGSEASTPKSALSIVSAFGMPRKRIQRNTKTPPLRSMSPSAFPSSLRRSTSTPLQRPTPPKTPRSVSPHLGRFNTLKNGSPEATAEVLRQEGETLMRATPIVARPASAYQTRRKSWSPSLRTSLEHEQKELVAAKVPEALLGHAAAAACEGDLQGALHLLDQAKEHPATAEGGHMAEVLLRRGRVETALGDREAGLKSLAEAAETADKAWGKDDVRRSEVAVAYADTLVAAGRIGEAAALYRMAGDMLAKEIGPSHLVVLEVRQRQAAAEVAGGPAGEGVGLLESGRAAKQAALLPYSPVRATGLQALAEAYAAQRRMDAALACWEEAARIQAVALPSRSPTVARSLLLGAGLYQAKGRKKEASDAVKRALTIEESIQPTGSSHLALSLAQASTVMRAQKRYDEALATAHRSVSLHGRTSPASPLEVAASLEALGSVHMCRKRYAEAQPLFNRALTIHEETKTRATRATADLLTNMAECAEAQGRKEKAQPLLERAVGIYEDSGVREDDPAYAKSKKKLTGFKRPLGGFCCSAPSTM